MKKKHIIALVISVLFIGIAAFALIDNKIVYADFQTAQSSGKRVQVSGVQVKEKPAVYDAKANLFTFTMKDHNGIEMSVRYNGIKPTNFEISPNVVCVGKVENGVFEVSEIQTKCPSRYENSGKINSSM
jgi:cytochrome c-type biogenesis protein CcmE